MDELTRRKRIEEEAKTLLSRGGLMIRLTPHFLKQAFQRPGLRWKGFPLLAAKLALLAADAPGVDHMATSGATKVIYLVELLPREDDDPVLKLIFKTAMPKDFKHNVFNKAKTIRLGEVE